MDETGINNYFTCCGPNSSFVKLVSNDGHEFVIPRRHIINSSTILDMLTGPGKVADKAPNAVYFHEFSSHMLRRVCHYLAFNFRYSNKNEMIPYFDISTTEVFDIMMCADFLKC